MIQHVLLDGRYDAVVSTEQSASLGIPAVVFRGSVYRVGHVIRLPDGKGVLASDYLPPETPRVNRESRYDLSSRLRMAAGLLLAVIIFSGEWLPVVLAAGGVVAGGALLFAVLRMYARRRREAATRERMYQEASKRERRALVELECLYQNSAAREAKFRARDAVRTQRAIEKHRAREARRLARRLERVVRQRTREAEEYRAREARRLLREAWMTDLNTALRGQARQQNDARIMRELVEGWGMSEVTIEYHTGQLRLPFSWRMRRSLEQLLLQLLQALHQQRSALDPAD